MTDGTDERVISKIAGNIELDELFTLLNDAVTNDRYFEIGPRAARTLRDAFVFAAVHGGHLAAAQAHRACCSEEHSPHQGRLHGYCIVCGVPWPCETARFFLRKPQS